MSLTFKGIGVGGFGGYELTDTLQMNLKWFLDWGLLHNGGFEPIILGDQSAIRSDESRLRIVADERYLEGQVWAGYGKEWVWESGVAIDAPPFRVSGVYIDGVFHPVGETGPYAFHVDYQNGRIIFDIPMGSGQTIQAEYCHRMVNVAPADHPDFRVLLQAAMTDFASGTEPSGTPIREHQVWLPSVFIDVDRGRQRGLQLGGGQIKTRNIVLHIFADKLGDRNLLLDWLDYQSRSAFHLADLNSVTLPFDQYGDVVPGATNWPGMATEAPWKKMRILNGECRKLPSFNPNIFRGRVEWLAEIDFGGI